MSNRVCAAIVAYHPDAALAAHVQALRPQVDELLLVDNGSGTDADALLSRCVALGAHLIRLPENLGIAAALNVAVQHARAAGHTWLATFDQDSHAPVALIDNLLAVLPDIPDANTIASLSPLFRNQTTGAIVHQPLLDPAGPDLRWRAVAEVITSGSLIRLDAAAQVGDFDERLFIDGVDTDFCLRCRAQGYRIIEVQTTCLDHQLGQSAARNVLGVRKTVTQHSPLRRYYIARNNLYLAKRWLLRRPDWAWHYLSKLLRTLLMVLLEAQRGRKFRAMLGGIWDALCNQMGRSRREW